jgi:hypothetical protein
MPALKASEKSILTERGALSFADCIAFSSLEARRFPAFRSRVGCTGHVLHDPAEMLISKADLERRRLFADACQSISHAIQPSDYTRHDVDPLALIVVVIIGHSLGPLR